MLVKVQFGETGKEIWRQVAGFNSISSLGTFLRRDLMRLLKIRMGREKTWFRIAWSNGNAVFAPREE